MQWLKFFKVRRKRKVIGHMTSFPMLELYSKLCNGEITLKEYSEVKDLDPITKPIYDNTDVD